MTKACRDAVKLAINFFEAEHIMILTQTLEDQIESWYDNSDVTDPRFLAAAAIEYGYFKHIDFDEWDRIAEFYFFPIPVEFQGLAHISEIEESYHDLDFFDQEGDFYVD